MQTWNERLKERREALNYRKADVAKFVGVSSATVTDWENGTIKKIEGEHLLKVCRMLKCAPEWLLTGRSNGQRENADGTPLNSRQEALLGLFDGLTAAQQDEAIRRLQDQKRENDLILSELTGKGR